MKNIYKILIGVAIAAVVVLVIYLLKDSKILGGAFGNLWVWLSGIYASVMILLGNFKGIFGGGKKRGSIRQLEDRLGEIRRIEKDLIDTLMAERAVFKDRISELESRRVHVQKQIDKQEHVLETQYSNPDVWREEVWSRYTQEEQQQKIEDLIGPTVDVSQLVPDAENM